MPKAVQREQLWKTLLPPKAPLASDVDFKALGEKYKVIFFFMCASVYVFAVCVCLFVCPLSLLQTRANSATRVTYV